MINIIEAYKKRKPVKPNITNQGTVTRCPDCGAIQFKVLPNVNISYCSRCGKALDFTGIEYRVYAPREDELDWY